MCKSHLLYLSILSLMVLSACGNNNKLEQALELAGDNRAQLEQVLHYYSKNPDDSLKLKAAEFLIENMMWHYYYDGDGIRDYNRAVKALYASNPGLSFAGKVDSLYKQAMPVDNYSVNLDIQNINAGLLIDNIDKAFETLEYDWANELNFEVFCEYILPYKPDTSIPEKWRTSYIEKFKETANSLWQAEHTQTSICEYISHYYHSFYSPISNPALPASVLLDLKGGNCIYTSALGVYAGRALGMPVAIDFTPQWKNRFDRHTWNALLLQGDSLVPFEVSNLENIELHLTLHSNTREPSKVYRRTYSAQEDRVKILSRRVEVSPLFRDPCMVDVSEYYNEVHNITLELEQKSRAGIYYLMMFDRAEFAPVDWSVDISSKGVTFDKIPGECVFIVSEYVDGVFKPLSYPYSLDINGRLTKLKPQQEYLTAEITRKAPSNNVAPYIGRMVGGRLQVANRPDFSDAVDICVFDTAPEICFHTVDTGLDGKFHYFRYYSPEENSYGGNMAEIILYDENGVEITGDIIGTEGSLWGWGMVKEYVFDDDVLTYFDAPHSAGGWVGMSFDEPALIDKIVYLPRNDDNFIREGEEYELFYRDAEDWVSLGQQIGSFDTQKLIYDSVPQNSLLLLRNHSKGTEERIFTYEDGKQIWW